MTKEILPHTIYIRPIESKDCTLISKAFEKYGLNKPRSLYEQYVQWQKEAVRDVLIAEVNGDFTGYLTIQWESGYEPFKAANVPEIVDFNVLPDYRRQGIGTKLMDEAERRIKIVSPSAGIGFGLYKDYGAAQILYIKRGYIPDGNGLLKDGHVVRPGTTLFVDDSLAIYLTKQL